MAVAAANVMTAPEFVTLAGVVEGSDPEDAEAAGHAENCRLSVDPEPLFEALPVNVSVVPTQVETVPICLDAVIS